MDSAPRSGTCRRWLDRARVVAVAVVGVTLGGCCTCQISQLNLPKLPDRIQPSLSGLIWRDMTTLPVGLRIEETRIFGETLYFRLVHHVANQTRRYFLARMEASGSWQVAELPWAIEGFDEGSEPGSPEGTSHSARPSNGEDTTLIRPFI